MTAEGLRGPAGSLARLTEQVGGRLTALPRRWRLAAVVLLAAAQLAVPAAWIAGFERTLAEGRAFRFRAAPVDPADPLRGRYVMLAFAAAQEVAVPADLDLDWNEQVWVRVSEGADGFARLDAPTRERPTEGDFLRVRVRGTVGEVRRAVLLDRPFDRFFLEEGDAPAAEELLRTVPAVRGRAAGATDTDAPVPVAWAVVRLRDGRAVIEDVLVDGVPLREAVDGPATGAPRSGPAARP